MKLVPQIWVDALLESHISKLNVTHHPLQEEPPGTLFHDMMQAHMAYTLLMIRVLGYDAVLCDGVYQLERRS